MVKKLEAIKSSMETVYDNMTEIQAEGESVGSITQAFLARISISTNNDMIYAYIMMCWICIMDVFSTLHC